jgi:outer membrane lipoprotein carrier protein
LAGAIAVFAAAGLFQPALSDVTDAELLERVRARYSSIETLQASFEQVNDWDLLGESATYRGELSVSTDGRVRIAYSEPEGHVFVADGEWLWTFVPESGQVLKSAPGEDRTELSRLFLDFLAGNRVLRIDRTSSEADLVLETDDTSSLRELVVTVDTESGLGTRFMWIDAEGNTARYRFDSTRINRPLAPDTFVFHPPDGVDVVELGGER